ncbi:MAG: FAD-dependent thymidylate synthase [Pyrinomonadaceae bacterium]|nr:FAD-dependent thymidylate synthase [Pyrinomonadaceae bacterium]
MSEQTFPSEPIPVLDSGFVRLVDFMGGDLAVVQGARVSFGQETKGDERDRKLIDYLMKHEHGTPFEMSVFKFHVKAPIFVARQWFRHRVGCLSGETRLYFDLPSATARGGRQLHKANLKKLYELWHEGSVHVVGKRKPLHLDEVKADESYSVPELARLVERRAEDLRNLIRRGALKATRVAPRSKKEASLYVRGEDWREYAESSFVARAPMKERLRHMKLRMCNEATGEIEHTQIADIWQSGVKHVYRVTLQNGYRIKMTEEHRCLTERGWLTLKDATNLRRSETGSVTWDGDAPAFSVNGIEKYRDADWLSARRREGLSVTEIALQAGASYHTIRKYLSEFKLQYSARERAQLAGAVQRGQRRSFKRKALTTLALNNIRTARSGARSNEQSESLHAFCKNHQPQSYPESKPKPAPARLLRTFSPVARIEYVGEEMTYDLEVTGPFHNFIADGFVVHNSYNEISYRYVEVKDEFYIPDVMRAQDAKNKQASFAGAFTAEENERGRALIETAYTEAYERYRHLLEMGVAREMARIVLPVGMYTQFYVAYNARSLMNFVRLRTGAGAQSEIRDYAEAMNRIFKERMPWTYAAFERYVLKRGEAT